MALDHEKPLAPFKANNDAITAVIKALGYVYDEQKPDVPLDYFILQNLCFTAMFITDTSCEHADLEVESFDSLVESYKVNFANLRKKHFE